MLLSASSNINPSLPPDGERADNFRSKNICDYQKELENEISHYKQVPRNYRRVKSNAHATSSSGLAPSLGGINGVIGAPLFASAVLFDFISREASVCGQILERKISKHEKATSLDEAKLLSISSLIPKALDDMSISEIEFNTILREDAQYHLLKEKIRQIYSTRSKEKIKVEALKD